ncbi:hypothetical protein ACFP47_10150 [Nesterenkonia lacusekhoensis]|uniref:Uncharacterized protein n=1 Tax=Nesterenkonia lacusekhoensis TaxID=150832 RepID=A0ABS4T550_9MICC|nr:hypothetical protein [Nesterenkonia lacusekhoensis]MBP2319562.1 hypothetical protein [Nesterenkonia lacusekhoensis]
MSNWITAVAATTIAVVLLKSVRKPQRQNIAVHYPVRETKSR